MPSIMVSLVWKQLTAQAMYWGRMIPLEDWPQVFFQFLRGKYFLLPNAGFILEATKRRSFTDANYCGALGMEAVDLTISVLG